MNPIFAGKRPIMPVASVRQHPNTWFYTVWLLLNLIQAFGTELLHDEAYYWIYSRFLDWGYFDHPPMIGVLIKMGYALFPNELGVRLGMAVMNTATLWLVQQLLLKKDDTLFYAIAGCMGLLQIGGILAVPDIPLTFFTALFFWQYRNFLERQSWANAFALGLVMAAMLYSKYHGILIILFTIASNWKLILNSRAWAAVITGVLLFFPHLYWQYEHGFPSVMFHLKERNAPAYQFAFSLEYVVGQILLAGPLVGFFLLRAAQQYNSASVFAKSLKWSMWGFYGFFLLSTFKGRVEANWTVPALVPLIILSHAWLADQVKPRQRIFRLLVPSLILVFIVRIYMLTDIKPLTRLVKDELHGNKDWAAAIQTASRGVPVVFFNSYQRPSKYWFYAGDTSFALNTTTYRRTNFNFWPMEKQAQSKKQFLVDNDCSVDSNAVAIETRRGKTYGRIDSALQSYSFIRLEADTTPAVVSSGLTPLFYVTQSKDRTMGLEGKAIVADIFLGKNLVQRVDLDIVKGNALQYTLQGRQAIALNPGKYILKLGIATSILGQYTQSSPATSLEIR